MSIDPFLEPEGPWGAIFSLPSIAVKVDELIRLWISDAEERYSIFDELAYKSEQGAGGLFINPLSCDTCDLSCYEKRYCKGNNGECSFFIEAQDKYAFR